MTGWATSARAACQPDAGPAHLAGPLERASSERLNASWWVLRLGAPVCPVGGASRARTVQLVLRNANPPRAAAAPPAASLARATPAPPRPGTSIPEPCPAVVPPAEPPPRESAAPPGSPPRAPCAAARLARPPPAHLRSLSSPRPVISAKAGIHSPPRPGAVLHRTRRPAPRINLQARSRCSARPSQPRLGADALGHAAVSGRHRRPERPAEREVEEQDHGSRTGSV